MGIRQAQSQGEAILGRPWVEIKISTDFNVLVDFRETLRRGWEGVAGGTAIRLKR